MTKEVCLRLPSLVVGQILDALHEKMEAWTYTAEFLETGIVSEDRYVEECSDSKEAKSIANYYQDIIQTIETQTENG
jgi:hypothetical protein